jgi:hypothetical protein
VFDDRGTDIRALGGASVGREHRERLGGCVAAVRRDLVWPREHRHRRVADRLTRDAVRHADRGGADRRRVAHHGASGARDQAGSASDEEDARAHHVVSVARPVRRAREGSPSRIRRGRHPSPTSPNRYVSKMSARSGTCCGAMSVPTLFAETTLAARSKIAALSRFGS